MKTSLFKSLSILCALIAGMVLFSTNHVLANAISAAATGNWNSTGTWSGGVVPTSADDVTIDGGFTVTVTSTGAAAHSIQLGTSGGGAGTLTFSGTSDLTVGTSITAGSTSGSNAGTLTMTIGATLTAGSIANGGGGASNYTLNAGTVVLTGTFSLPTGANAYNNLTVNGGTVTQTQNMTIAGDLSIGSTSEFDCDGIHTLSISGNVSTNSGNASSNLKALGSAISVTGNITGPGKLFLKGTEAFTINGNFTIAGFTSNDGGNFGSTVIFGGSGAQSLDPGNGSSYAFDNLTINNSGSGVTLNGSATQIEIDWDLSGSGILHTSTCPVVLVGNMTLTNFDVSNNTELLTLDGQIWQSFSGRVQFINSQTFSQVVVANSNTHLTGSVTIKSSLEFDAGNIILGGNNLVINSGAALAWGASTAHSVSEATIIADGWVVTNSSGTLQMATTTGTGLLYPVGTDTFTYTPIRFTASSGAPRLDVRVKPGVTDNTITALTGKAVNKTWVVVPENASAQNFTLETHWETNADELTSSGALDRTHTFISWRTAETNPTSWTALASGTTTANSGTTSGAGVRDSIPGGANLSMSSANTFYIATGSDLTALPVTLTAFSTQYDNGHVNLNWSTASEINNAFFEIQRSTDSRTWNVIGKVDGHGNSLVINNYTAVDNLAGLAPAGTLYYRLRQVDFNGEYSYSDIRSVNLQNDVNAMSTYPNPSASTLNIDWNGTSETSMLKIMNISGVTIYTETVSGNGPLHRQVDLSAYPAGAYYVQLIDGDKSITKTIYRR
jgi:hypothetical protein